MLLFFAANFAQNCDWQQRVDYQMEIDVNEKDFTYTGKMKVVYQNQSQETLNKIYFHLYYNAFQPGSAMDYRLRNIPDPDSRMVLKEGEGQNRKVTSRIAVLKPEDQGNHTIKSIKQNGVSLKYKITGTILEVELNSPLLPNSSVEFDMDWDARIPEMIRRGGKNSPEGVDFTMTQWYPKIAQFDEEGWHLDEYIGREFIAPFGNFDVKITIREDYVIGSSGKLQNPDRVKGYVPNPKIEAKDGKIVWHFKAENIHDFAWAADPGFVVSEKQVPGGPKVYFVHLNRDDINQNWVKAQEPTVRFFQFMNEYFGKYPWETYSIVQGGDGGMEYGTSTLVTGGRNLDSLIGVIFHEAAHSWFQHLFGINETVNEWMDEGFTSYAEQLAFLEIFQKEQTPNPNPGAYSGYFDLARSGVEEPMSLLADYYNYNYAYGVEAYVKGQVYLIQLAYIIGEENLKKTFKEFYDQWKFRHPDPNDFKRTAENVSGLNLKWYNNLFINTTRTIDYAIESVSNQEIKLKNLSNFAMPIDLLVEYQDGTKELFYIPNLELRGEKPAENLEIYKNVKRTTLEPWAWTSPGYSVKINKKVVKAEIDPTKRLADIADGNNIYPGK